ncbi:MAG: signal transduction histidine kinase/CheY-like chemotaxis protein/PAS domain-containing protein [Planctomycetota bacterium]|jgi:signal transduction histidine kinase/CheY-like chemotaxis protein/PAS domain-containing protein
MRSVGKPPDEAIRLETLHSCKILDSEPELVYDDITRLLSLACDVPMAVIALVDDERVWSKSNAGFAGVDVSRDDSFCSHTILQSDALIVPDTLQDRRFAESVLVTGKSNLRFYAGTAIVMSDGQAIGAVAVMDVRPREMTSEQIETLLAMGRQVASLLELRRRMHQQEVDRKRLEQTTERLNLVVEAASAGIWDLDLGLHSVFLSPRVFDMMGLSNTSGQVPLAGIWPLVHPDDRRKLVRAAVGQLRRGSPFEHEFRCRHVEDGWRWFSARALSAETARGESRRLVGSLKDIHAERAAKDRLLQVSRLLAESQALGQIGGWELDLSTDSLFWTAETYRIHDASPSTFVPTMDRAIACFVPAAQIEVRAALEDAVARGRAFSLDLELVTARGRKIWVRATGGAVFVGRRAVRVLGALQNITAQRLLDEELVRAKEAAESASESKSAFLAAMSHEIRTPMHTVLGYTDMLRDSTLDDEQQECVDIIATSGNSLLRLIDDILDFSKVEAGKMLLDRQSFDVHDVVLKVARMMQPQAQQKGQQKGLSVRVECSGHGPYLAFADPQRVHQVLVNLAGNAVKFTAAGEVVLGVSVVDGRVRVAVKDTGIGIAPEALNKLFEDFVQVDSSTQREYGGTGLGLAISKKLIEVMGGKIGVSSEPGAGSVFWFELPVAAEVQVAADVSGDESRTFSVGELAVTTGRKVLVVEDNRLNLRLAVRVLETFGLQVDTAVDGESATKMVNENSYDLVLMDCLMPGMDGFEATRRIREDEAVTGEHMPIIALTANALPEDRDACLVAGMDDFVSKPFTRQTLLQAMVRWLTVDAN